MKPIQAAIESLRAKSLCPRLHVDVTHPDAVCPDFVRDKWKERLVIDLDPGYPLDLAFTKLGVEADLSFGGYVTRCIFPWAAIYVVADRATGRGQVFATNIPASLRHEFGVPQAPTIDPALTKVRDDMKAKPGSRRHKRRGPESIDPPQGIRAVEDASEPEDEDDAEAPVAEAPVAEAPVAEAPPAKGTSTEQTAQKRRSAFKVIDGG
ncbi:ClpXP protease specificity-enhancing factor SspB [Nannocystaceae bacterium ST9]